MANVVIQTLGIAAMDRELKVKGVKMKTHWPKILRAAGLLGAKEVKLQIRGSRTRARRAGNKPGLYRRVTRKKGTGRFAKKGSKGSRSRFERAGHLPNNVLAIDSGHLRRSIGSRSQPGGVFRLGRSGFGKHYVEVGTNVKYAAIHEFGGQGLAFGKYPFKMPKRPFLAPGVRKATPKIRKLINMRVRGIMLRQRRGRRR